MSAAARPATATYITPRVAAVRQHLRSLERAYPAIVFAAAFVLFVARRPQVLFAPEFRGEDGQTFYLATYFLNPLASLFEPNGFLYVVPRMIALLSRLVPVADAPLVTNGLSVLITAGVATYIATRLNVDRPIRLALGLLVVILPGVSETHGQAAWLGWYLAPFLVAVPFARRPASAIGRWLEVGAVLLASLSTPLAAVLWPLYVRSGYRLLAPASIGGVAQLVTGLLIPRIAPAQNLADLPWLIVQRAVAEPFLGSLAVNTALVLAVAGLVVLAVWRAPRRWIVIAGYIWVVSLASVILKSSEPFASYADAFSGNRYFLLPGLALVGLVVASAIRDHGTAAMALCLILAVGIAADFRLTDQPYLGWPERSACIGGPDPCVVPVFPAEVFSVRWPRPDGVYDPRARAL